MSEAGVAGAIDLPHPRAPSGATNLASINSTQLRGMPLPVPPRGLQQEIVNCFRIVDRAIENTERSIYTKETLFRGLMQQLFTGRRRLPTFADQPWDEVRLGAVTRDCSRRNAGALGIDRVMAVNKVHGLIPMRERTIASDLDRYKIVQPVAFAYNPMRINIGSIARSYFDKDVLVSPDYVVFESTECDPS